MFNRYPNNPYGGSDRDTSRPSNGHIYFLEVGITSYVSRLQRMSAPSSTESELIALAQAVKEGACLSGPGPYTVRVDNIASMFPSQSSFYSPRIHHFEVSFHSLRQAVADGWLTLQHVSSKHQRADPLNKFVGRRYLQRAIEVVRIGLTTGWGVDMELRSSTKLYSRQKSNPFTTE